LAKTHTAVRNLVDVLEQQGPAPSEVQH